jgi:hypothetical protein
MEQQSLQFAPPETLPLLSPQTASVDVAQTTTTPGLTEDLTPEERQLVRTIPRLRNRALRREAANTLRQAPPEVLTPLLTALQKPFARRWREAQVAAWVLGRAPLRFPEQKQEAVEALTRLLKIPVPRTHLRRLPVTRLLMLAVLIFALPAITVVILDQWLHWIDFHIRAGDVFDMLLAVCFLFAFCMMVLLTPFSLMIDIARDKRRGRVRATAAAALGRLAAPESMDVLAETLKDTTPAVHKVALRALVPLLTPAHYGHFGLHVTAALCRVLHDKDDAWVLECLDGLEKVGDSSAIPAVERLSQFHFREIWEEETSERVRERAAQVLTILEQRRAQDNAPRHLLRASGEPAAAPNILLRAAMGDSSADGAQLLRASIDAEP